MQGAWHRGLRTHGEPLTHQVSTLQQPACDQGQSRTGRPRPARTRTHTIYGIHFGHRSRGMSDVMHHVCVPHSRRRFGLRRLGGLGSGMLPGVSTVSHIVCSTRAGPTCTYVSPVPVRPPSAAVCTSLFASYAVCCSTVVAHMTVHSVAQHGHCSEHQKNMGRRHVIASFVSTTLGFGAFAYQD